MFHQQNTCLIILGLLCGVVGCPTVRALFSRLPLRSFSACEYEPGQQTGHAPGRAEGLHGAGLSETALSRGRSRMRHNTGSHTGHE